MSLTDRLKRPLQDLRISVTDRCNFRCNYCMPKEIFDRNYAFLQREQLLSFEEITRVAKAFINLGVRKIRLTGGEPLLRKNIERLIEMLAELGAEIALTTNGSFPTHRVSSLKNAGLNRMTISLDSLDDGVFRAMNDVDFPVQRVLDWIDACEREKLAPVKINMVVRRGWNEVSVLPMMQYFKGSGHILRFVEFMDVGHTNGWKMDDVVRAQEIVEMIRREAPISPITPNYAGEVAKRWRFDDGTGEIGIIASVTQAFCRDCSRIRLSADGSLFTCLFATKGFDLRQRLRSNMSEEALEETIQNIWRKRTDRYSEIRSEKTVNLDKIEMSYIGG